MENNIESPKEIRSRYTEHYFNALYVLYTSIKDTNGKIDIKEFCEKHEIFYCAPHLQREGILVNHGDKRHTRSWEWVGPIPTKHQAEALLRRAYIKTILAADPSLKNGQKSIDPPIEEAEEVLEEVLEETAEWTPEVKKILIKGEHALMYGDRPKIKSKKTILGGFFYTKTEYYN